VTHGDRNRSVYSCVTILGVTLVATLTGMDGQSAWGQVPTASDDTSAQIRVIENQIRHLQNELANVRRDLARREADVRAARQEAARATEKAQQANARASVAVAAPAPALPQKPPPPGFAYNVSPPVSPLVPPGLPGPYAQGTVGQQQASLVGGKQGTFQVGGVFVTLGGFIEAAGIFRSRNEVADIASNFNTGIPLPNSQQYYERENRFSARQSRLSLLMTGNPDADTELQAYFETDFQGGSPTANSNQSNSYTLRIRQAYATYARTDWGFYGLGGQAWSLGTMFRTGLIPRQENVPLTIDASYVPGFFWARQPQFRVVKEFDNHVISVGLSLENPQTTFSPTGPNGLVPASVGTVNTGNPGGSLLTPTVNYSTNIAPDIIGKMAFDPGWGHYELWGIARFMQTRVSVVGSGSNKNAAAGGVGANALLPLVPKALDLQLSLLGGYGLGRYGAAGLPDATVGSQGQPVPLPEVMALVGLVGHPTGNIDLYTYAGTEQESKKDFAVGSKGFGYGSPLYDNATCDIELGPASGCVGDTSGVWQVTLGGWWRFLHGWYGTMELGAQYSYTHRQIFEGIGGAPSTNEQILMTSFRYLPFQ
jgi:outer membrane murein-binding lipoprotein Lpp